MEDSPADFFNATLLAKLGRSDEARAELERAASLTRNSRERKLLLDRAGALDHALRVVK